jgi:aspartyl/glutamyl-tRNA(Asn/Gln) amidotransferase C subunit
MLINTHDLANLARISLTEEEHTAYAKDIESILQFIDTIQSLSITNTGALQSTGMAPVDVVREDRDMRLDGQFSAAEIVAEAPETEVGFIKVKKILN